MGLDASPHLFVEGKLDEYLVVQVLKHNGLFAHAHHGKALKREDEAKVEIVVRHVGEAEGSSGSKSELLRDIYGRIANPKPRAVGYVFDADDREFTGENLASTWQAVRNQLAKSPASIQTSDRPPSDGFIARHAKTDTAIGVWIMPDNLRDGSLEDFIRDLTQTSDKLLPHAESSTEAAKANFEAPYELKDFKKAVLHAWLAWQVEPGMTFATAFSKQRFRADAPLAKSFSDWVKRLIA